MTYLAHRLRAPCADDVPLMARSWVQEMRHSPWSQGVPDDEYYPRQRKLVAHWLEHAWTLVATNPDDARHIYGFVTFELGKAPRLHWLYVKGPYQRVGLGVSLLRSAFGVLLGSTRIECTQASRGTLRARGWLERSKLVPVHIWAPAPAAMGGKGEHVNEFEPATGKD